MEVSAIIQAGSAWQAHTTVNGTRRITEWKALADQLPEVNDGD